MLHKNIIKLAALLWCVLTVASCTNEDFDKGNNGPDVPEGLPVTLKLNIGTPEVPVVETKSLENEDKTFGAINNLAVLVYDEKGENPIVTFYEVEGENQTSVSDVPFSAKTGKHKIYVLTNVGSEGAAKAYTTEQALLSKQIESPVPQGTEMMLGFVAKDMETSINLYNSGSSNPAIDITDDASFAAKVVPPYSKITFKITKDLPSDKHVYLAITEVNVRHLPVKYSLLPYEKWTMGDGVSGESKISLYENKLAQPEDEVGDLATGKAFYMYENLQGKNNESNQNPAMKTPAGLAVPTQGDGKIDYAAWFEKWSSVPCTYIEVKGNYTIFTSAPGVNHVGDGEINYRFFLGENSTSDFNIKRNTHYNVTLAFTGLAGKDELQYEWRVQADLENSTFYPKGTLVIDGAVSPVGSVPFYVLNGTSSSLSVTVGDLLNMDMEMYFLVKGKGVPDYWTGSQTPLAEYLQLGANEYTMFGIHPRNVGILGSVGHTTGTNKYVYEGHADDKEYNKIESNATEPYRTAVANGEIYRTVSMQITGAEPLDVIEYPLLYLGTEDDNVGIGEKKEDKFYYARRVDGGARYFQDASDNYIRKYIPVTGKLSNMSEAKSNCAHEQYVTGASIYYYLPSINDMENIQKYEKAFPLKNDFYWTTNGLYNPVTKATATSGEGYIRCILKHK